MKRILAFSFLLLSSALVSADFKAGAVVVDVSPRDFPVLVNGGMTSRSATQVVDPINARALVLSDGQVQLAIVVVDSCMLARPVLDQAKRLASQRTGIPADRMLISATHTHTAPSSLGCLGTRADPRYTPYLVQKLAEAITAAQVRLQPAQVGWNNQNAAEFTALRRWVRRPDRVVEDPFGNPTVRANMHSGRNWDDVTGESGPEDPDLNIISIQARDGRPLAILANFSMHYFGGVKALSADYFGIFCNRLKEKIAPDTDFVGIMSHGCSGDIWRRDYTVTNWSKNPPKEPDWKVDEYADLLSDRALVDYRKIAHSSDVDLAMAETRMTLDYRTPDKQLLEWSQGVIGKMGDREPKTREEVYAMEQIILHERQQTEICLQALRIGDIAITTTPNETYAITALKLKAMSPLQKTMVIELANGGDGYIPPPEQHVIGGYNTWAARSAGLEEKAEPKIVEANLQMLEQVAGRHRRPHRPSNGPATRATLAAKPEAYWRLDEFSGPVAFDLAERHNGSYEDGVVYHLAGARSQAFNGPDEQNRAAHFCGGRMRANIGRVGEDYTVSIWFWNGMPDGARSVAGWMFSRDRDHATSANGDHLGLNGKNQLIFKHGSQATIAGAVSVKRWEWNHAALVREGDHVRVYLNGSTTPQIDVKTTSGFPEDFNQVFIGGRSDNSDNWEGRLDEVAIFPRALTAEEIRDLGAR